ncbi:hypothetical protein F4801DRAFT_333380 [Xylaria longipes]|nr:hypothetical protein F4801DRAFT_333380 [Xylaria longipes]RYC63161.1 hypothetical protein CHU98_g3052 [Xylaria longipes]
MDIIGSAAAVGQLLAQAISLWQQVQIARDSVKTAPKVLADTSAQLSNLSDIVLEIEREPELRTPEIHAQINIIRLIATEVCQRLEVMTKIQHKSALRQGLRAWSRGPRDEAKLADVLRRLENAKAELVLRINLVHLSITGGIADEIGRFVQVTETTNQAQAKKESNEHRLLIQGNEVKEIGDQINGIMGLEDSSRPTTAKIMRNVAHGKQRNFIGGKGSLLITHGLNS